MKQPNFKTRNLAILALPLILALLAGCGATQPTQSPRLGAPPFQSTARFDLPTGIAVDQDGNLYVADTGNNAIRLITPAGNVTTIEGIDAGITMPYGIAVDDADLMVSSLNAILQIKSDRTVGILAGSYDYFGNENGTGTDARFNKPAGIAVSPIDGNIYVVDTLNNQIRRITPEGTVSTFAGSGVAGNADGVGTHATFNQPYGIAADLQGFLYVSDYANNEIRLISPQGIVSTLAGSPTHGSADGQGSQASFYLPAGIAVTTSGYIYVADLMNNEIRCVSPLGVVTTVAGTLKAGSADGIGNEAGFKQPYGVAVDFRGNVFVADAGNNEIREISPSGVVTTLAGATTAGFKDGTALPRT